MIGRILACLALCATPGASEDPRPAAIAAAAAVHHFNGQILVQQGEAPLVDRWFGAPVKAAPNEVLVVDRAPPRDNAWPWASVTKQVVATLVMQQVGDGRIVLDVPAARYLPALARRGGGPTVRQLLQHRAGLPNPDDSPKDAGGAPGFYTTGATGLPWCLRGRTAPGGAWRYNNCDYIALGALLTRVTGKSVPALYAERIARPLRLAAQFVGAEDVLRLDWPGGVTPAERATLTRYGAAGGLAGTAADLMTFDRALLGGRLLAPAARAEMWKGDAGLGYMALGQWVFEAALKGCPQPVKMVERRGAIGRFQVRNIVLPDDGAVVIMLSNDGDFDFGEIWQGKGMSYDVLSAAACP